MDVFRADTVFGHGATMHIVQNRAWQLQASGVRPAVQAYRRVPMKKSSDLSLAQDPTAETAGESTTDMASLDWRAIAGQRLQRAIEFEQELAQTGKRLAGLQQDYLKLAAIAEQRLRETMLLDQSRLSLEQQLRDALNQRDAIQAMFLRSRSWRITRPLRALARSYAAIKNRWRRSPR
jgi:hypothetical protein